MKKVYLSLVLLTFVFMLSCHDDQSYKDNGGGSLEPGDISVLLTGRIGSRVGDSLSEYIDALNLLLFREDNSGVFRLFRQKVFGKEELEALAEGDKQTEAGYTVYKKVEFDSVPLGNYRIVGVGNVLNASGGVQPEVSFQGLVTGASQTDVLVSVLNGEQSPRLFWGETATIAAGGAADEIPVLRLYRKVSMFSLTLLKIPNVVYRIDMEFGNTYGSFNMAGNYTPDSEMRVYAMDEYAQQKQDSITLNYVMLPTVEGDSTTILATFYLSGAAKQPVVLPEYVLAPNTITKVTATIDPDQSGSAWKVNINSLITVEVEWNVDQEPPITI